MCDGGPYRFCFFVFDFGRFRNSFFRRSIFFPLIIPPVVLFLDETGGASLRGRPILRTPTLSSSLCARKQNAETITTTTLSLSLCVCVLLCELFLWRIRSRSPFCDNTLNLSLFSFFSKKLKRVTFFSFLAHRLSSFPVGVVE